MVAADLSVWQMLPTGPTGFGNSPYQLLSAFAGNPLFIDLEGLVELGLLEDFELARARPGDARSVDYAAVIADREYLLDVAADRLDRSASGGLMDEYLQFVATHDALWLRNFSLYSTLKRWFGLKAWVAWDTSFRDRDPTAIAVWEADHFADLERVRRIQFLFFHQWRALREYARSHDVALFGDIPIYLAHDCADAWAGREMLSLDHAGLPLEIGGVPPDYFNAAGQWWGNPLYRWEWHAEHGFSWWIDRLRHAFERFDLVRLDHFRGFEAYWAIPVHKPACEGEWRPGPGRRLFDAVFAALGQRQLVAEDLGKITDAVIDLRRQVNMPGMQVLQFLVGSDRFDPADIDEDSVCYTGTHDNDTTAGWFKGSGRLHGDDLMRWQGQVCDQLACQPEEVPKAMIRTALESHARLAVVPAQDILGLDSVARMNRPGTESGNWVWRLGHDQLNAETAARMQAMISASGRNEAAKA